MKRFVSITMTMILCVALMAGCGAKEVKLTDVMDKINAETSLSLQALSSVDELDRYYSIKAEDVKQFAAEIDSNSNAPTEIVLVEAVDSNAADNVEKALTNRYNSIYGIYSSYSPEQLDMVKACKVTKDGNFVSMIVSENAEKMLSIYNESIQ